MLLHEIAAENVTLCETFQVAALIEKLPPGWENFKNYLKHKRKAMSLENLIARLRVEEDNRKNDKSHSSQTIKKAMSLKLGKRGNL